MRRRCRRGGCCCAVRHSSPARRSCCSGSSARCSARRSPRTTRSRSSCWPPTPRRPAAHWFGTDQLGRDVLSRVIVGARDILLIAVAATVLGTVLGTALGLVMGYLGGIVDILVGRVVEAVLALPVVIVAFLFIVALGPSTADPDRGHRVRVHPADRPDRPVRRAGREPARLPVVRPPARREARAHHGRRDPAERAPGHPGRVHRAARIRHLRRGHAVVPRLRGTAADARLGRRTSPRTTASCRPATGGRRCSPRSPSPR